MGVIFLMSEGEGIKQILRGHKGDVLCLECPKAEEYRHVLLSGSEDGTARLWDIREGTTRFGSTRCFRSPGNNPVNAVQFGGTGETGDNRLFLASDNKIYCYDLRKPGSEETIIFKEEDLLYSFPALNDEINEMSINCTGSLLAAADDEGLISIYPISQLDELLTNPDSNISLSPICQLKHSREQDIICSSVKFITEKQIITGGMDCTVAKWNITKKSQISRINFSELQNANRMFNPNYIYNMDTLGNRLAVATGSGTLYIVNHMSGAIEEKLDIHASAISQVRIFTRNNINYMITAGNDCTIQTFELPPVAPPVVSQGGKKKRKKGKGKGKSSPALAPQKPKKLSTIQHSSKINWLAVPSNDIHDAKISFFIADQSNNITYHATR